MKTFIAVLFLSIASLVQAQETARPAIVIPDGTTVYVALTHTLSSANAGVGDPVLLEVVDDVVIDNKVIIAKGSQATGTVTEARKKKTLGRGGKLNFSVDSLTAFNGQKVIVAEDMSQQNGDRNYRKADYVGYIMPVAAFLVRGDDVVVPANKPFPIMINGDRRVNLR